MARSTSIFPTPENVGGIPPYMSRRTILKGSLFGAVAMGLAACGAGTSGSSAGSGGSGSKTSLVDAITAMPITLAFDDGRGAGYEAFESWLLLHSNLIVNPYKPDPKNKDILVQDWFHWEGQLAEGFDVSKDGLTYTFHLRKGVVSQAGNPLTADDVIWSYKRKIASPSIQGYLNIPAITNVDKQFKKIDDHTVSITVAEKGHGFPMLAVMSKISGHIYDSKLLKPHVTKEDPWAIAWSAKAGNYGFGPYVMTDYQDGVHIKYEASPHYYKGEMPIKTIIQQVVPDAANRASALKSGAVDVAVQLLPSDIADMSSNPDIETFNVGTNNFLWFMMNAQSSVFKDQKVRQALFKAIPYDQIIKNVYVGHAQAAKGWMDPDEPGYNPAGIPDQVYDPKGALALLKEAGVPTPVSFSIMCSNAVPDLQQAAVQIQSYAKAGGFNVSIDVVPATTDAERKNKRDYQALLMRDMVISWESQTYSLRLLRGTGPNDPGNWTGWAPPEFLAEIDKGVAAGDAFSAAAGVHWHNAHVMLMEGMTTVQICNAEPLMAYRKGLSPYTQRSDNVNELSRLTET